MNADYKNIGGGRIIVYITKEACNKDDIGDLIYRTHRDLFLGSNPCWSQDFGGVYAVEVQNFQSAQKLIEVLKKL